MFLLITLIPSYSINIKQLKAAFCNFGKLKSVKNIEIKLIFSKSNSQGANNPINKILYIKFMLNNCIKLIFKNFTFRIFLLFNF